MIEPNALAVTRVGFDARRRSLIDDVDADTHLHCAATRASALVLRLQQ